MPIPYAGNPSNYPASIQVPSGGDAPSSALFQTPYEGLADRTAWERQFTASNLAGNWYGATSPIAAGQVAGVYDYDPLGQRWLAAINLGGSQAFYITHDGGRTWTFVHSIGGQALAMTSTNGFGDTDIFIGGASGTLNRISAGGTFSTTGAAGIQANATGAAFDYFFDTINFGVVEDVARHLFTFVQTGGNFVGKWYGTQDGLSLAVWFDMSSALPAAFASGANHVGQLLVANTTNKRRATVNGDIQVLALCGATPGTDTPRLMKVVITAPAPSGTTTIADITANLPAPGASFIIGGLAYDDVFNLWGLVLCTASSGTYVYSSPDLAAWTQVHHFSSYSGNGGGLAIANGIWAVWLGTPTTGPSADAANRVAYSWNVPTALGSSVWQTGMMALAPTGNGSLYSAGNQLLAGSTAGAQISMQSGFSTGSNLL